MFVSHNNKKIIAYQWERMMVCNFIANCVTKDERGSWSVHFIDGNENQEAYINKIERNQEQ